MENCKDLDKLFGDNCIAVLSDGSFWFTCRLKDKYFFDGEQLMCGDKQKSNIKYIFAYQNGEFVRLYKAPTPLPRIQTGDFICNNMGDIGVVTGDFVCYQSGGFDRLSSIMKSNSYITEIRRPNTCCGFDLYNKMPVIWPEKIKNNA